MSLNWDVSDVEDYQNKKGYRLDNLIWGLMDIGVSEITKNNVKKVAARFDVLESVFGVRQDRYPTSEEIANGADENEGIPNPITIEDVENYVGLCTNVSNLTIAAFKKRIIQRLMRNHDGESW